jgi:chaperone modulatory protein CbpM
MIGILKDVEFFTQEQLIIRVCRLSADRLRCWIDEGFVRSADDRKERFDAVDIARLDFLRDLADDFDRTTEGIGIVLSLMDQVHTLRNQLLRLGKAVDCKPGEVREVIIEAFAGSAGRSKSAVP